MPRRSRADLNVVPLKQSASVRLQPPRTLADAEKELFLSIVGSCDVDHFRASHLPLLTAYCQASILAEEAAARLVSEGPVSFGKINAWAVIQEKAIRSLLGLSMRLRLSPQSRRLNTTPHPVPQSYYDRMELSHETD